MKKNINLFESCREVKWCPGCGNYAILRSMQKTMHSLGIPSEKVVFVSGIGCSGRFPYYINTYGFHTLHGRAPSVVTGLRSVRSDLIIWLVVGDGDGFSIGLSHILHMVRRNINVNVLFINNKVYALTKGQYSPTSDRGFVSKSSPYGSIENPINPLLMVLSAGCSFVARAIDSDAKNLRSVIVDAMNHQGTSFIEVLQNCNIFNNAVYSKLVDVETKYDRLLYLKNGEKLVFGKENSLSLGLSKKMDFEVCQNDDVNYNLPIHDTTDINILQLMLSKLSYSDIPFPVGIFRCVKHRVFNDEHVSLDAKSKKINKFSDLFL